MGDCRIISRVIFCSISIQFEFPEGSSQGLHPDLQKRWICSLSVYNNDRGRTSKCFLSFTFASTLNASTCLMMPSTLIYSAIKDSCSGSVKSILHVLKIYSLSTSSFKKPKQSMVLDRHFLFIWPALIIQSYAGECPSNSADCLCTNPQGTKSSSWSVQPASTFWNSTSDSGTLVYLFKSLTSTETWHHNLY